MPTVRTVVAHFDVNKTLVGIDSSKNRDLDATIMSMIAEYTVGEWETGYEAMSFKAYAEILHPSHPERVEQTIQGFITWLEDHQPEKIAEVVRLQERLKNRLKDTDDLAAIGPKIFKSFFIFKEALRSAGIAHAIVLRTFGSDGNATAARISHETGAKFNLGGSLTAGKLFLSDIDANTEEMVDPSKIYEIFKMAASQGSHMIIKDDYAAWNKANRIGTAGKPIYWDARDVETVVILFDDNLEQPTAEKPHRGIAHPIEINGALDGEHNNLMFQQVNTIEAILNPRYYLDRFNELLVAKGFFPIQA